MTFPDHDTHLNASDGRGGGGSTPPPPPSALTVGQIFGGYRILRVVGGGGMGQVYEAFDDELVRSVALKVMRADRVADPDACDRFLREARALAAVSNPHVVTIHHVGQPDGLPFLVMELVAGETLEAHLQHSAFPLLQLLHTAREVACGLAAAHRAGVIHRDVKPENVVLSAADGRAKLIDFGLAHTPRVCQDADGTVGTPLYMAPEQVRGSVVTARSDLFSFGVLLYRMATGRTPFEGETVLEWQHRLLSAERPTPVEHLNPTIPPPLAGLIHRLLAKEPDDRPESAHAVEWELATLLKEVASQSGVHSARAAGSNLSNAGGIQVPQKRARLPWWLWAGVGAVLVAVPLFLLMAVEALLLHPGRRSTETLSTPSLTADKDPTTRVRAGGKPVRLFDGRTLTGWRSVGGKGEHWAVRNAVLVGTPRPGGDQYLLSEPEFGEYILAFEFRWPDKGDHTTVVVRAAEEGDTVNGLDVNLYLAPDEATTKDELRLFSNPQHAAGGVHKLRGPTTPVRNMPLGRWNTVKVTNTTSRLTIEWNGKLTFDEPLADYEGKRAELPALGRGTGRIALRTHRFMPVEYRNLVVTPLE